MSAYELSRFIETYAPRGVVVTRVRFSVRTGKNNQFGRHPLQYEFCTRDCINHALLIFLLCQLVQYARYTDPIDPLFGRAGVELVRRGMDSRLYPGGMEERRPTGEENRVSRQVMHSLDINNPIKRSSAHLTGQTLTFSSNSVRVRGVTSVDLDRVEHRLPLEEVARHCGHRQVKSNNRYKRRRGEVNGLRVLHNLVDPAFFLHRNTRPSAVFHIEAPGAASARASVAAAGGASVAATATAPGAGSGRAPRTVSARTPRAASARAPVATLSLTPVASSTRVPRAASATAPVASAAAVRAPALRATTTTSIPSAVAPRPPVVRGLDRPMYNEQGKVILYDISHLYNESGEFIEDDSSSEEEREVREEIDEITEFTDDELPEPPSKRRKG